MPSSNVTQLTFEGADFTVNFIFGWPEFIWHNVDFKLLPGKHTETST